MAGTDVARTQDYETGLEDLALLGGGVATPRISIDHKKGCFVDSMSGEEFDKLQVIPLGVVGQRVLWPPDMEDEPSDPLCKSLDAVRGKPGEEFPWKASGYKKSDVDAEGHLDCAACPLKDWDSHPKKDMAWCTEQITVPVLRQLANGKISPALITFQRSAMGNARKYFQSFATSGEPPFVAYLTITLEMRKRGSNPYGVPLFKRGGLTDEDAHDEFAEQFRSIREFLRTPREDDADETEEDEVEETPAPKTKKSAKAKKPEPEPEEEPVAEAEVVEEEDDEDDEEIRRLEEMLAAKKAAKSAPGNEEPF